MSNTSCEPFDRRCVEAGPAAVVGERRERSQALRPVHVDAQRNADRALDQAAHRPPEPGRHVDAVRDRLDRVPGELLPGVRGGGAVDWTVRVRSRRLDAAVRRPRAAGVATAALAAQLPHGEVAGLLKLESSTSDVFSPPNVLAFESFADQGYFSGLEKIQNQRVNASGHPANTPSPQLQNGKLQWTQTYGSFKVGLTIPKQMTLRRSH